MDDHTLKESVEVNAEPVPAKEQEGFIAFEVQLLILTWITFFLLCVVLYKLAWKPILAALDQREESIRRAVEEADKTHEAYVKIEETREGIIRAADEQAKETVAQARKAAVNAAKVIEERAKNEAQIILENSQRELKSQRDKAQETLRRESATVAVELAGKLIRENLNEEKNRKLIDQLIKEI